MGKNRVLLLLSGEHLQSICAVFAGVFFVSTAGFTGEDSGPIWIARAVRRSSLEARIQYDLVTRLAGRGYKNCGGQSYRSGRRAW